MCVEGQDIDNNVAVSDTSSHVKIRPDPLNLIRSLKDLDEK